MVKMWFTEKKQLKWSNVAPSYKLLKFVKMWRTLEKNLIW